MRKKLIIKQESSKDCGSACLLSILRYYGGNAPISKIMELTNTNKEGTNFYNIKHAAQILGLSAKGYHLSSIDYLFKLNSPSICQINMKNYLHFIVVYKVNDDKLQIMDPTVGARDMVIDEFQKRWTGNIMIFEPKQKLINYKEEKIVHNIIERIISKNKKIYLSVILMSIIYTITSCLYSYYMKITIDKVIEGSINNLMIITIIFTSIVIIKNLSNLFRNNILIYINEKIDFSILNIIYQKILLLPYNYFYNHKTGDIISRINDLSKIKQILNKITITILLDGLVLIISSIILYNISPVLFKILVVNVIIYILLLLIFRPIYQTYTKKVQENSAELNNFLVETISSFETIKGLGIESVMSNKLEKLTINNITTNTAYEKKVTIQNFLKDIVNSISIIAIMYIGSKEIINSNLALTNFITFNAVLIYFSDSIRNIINLNEEYQYLKNAIKRVNSIFVIKSLNLNKEDNLVVNGNINIKNLDFSFNGYNQILKNIELEIKDNNKVLILGPSGSGKSTLLKILMKYYDVKRNTIFINDIDICDYSNNTIKKNIVYVSQNELLYTDTIKNNIVLNRKVDDDNFLKICKMTKVDEIINDTFLGYDTILEENAHNLSGGQRQRIILARSLVSNSKILLIDEGLNQLDINLERKILKELFKLNKTIIIVSHRIDNMDLYDEVIKMKDGQIDVILKKEGLEYE